MDQLTTQTSMLLLATFPMETLSSYTLAYAISCLQPGISYFHSTFQHKLQVPMAAFKEPQLFSPATVYELSHSSQDVDTLHISPSLNDPTTIAGLKPDSWCEACLEWWDRNCGELPNWSSAARKVLLVQPSSVVAERVFSLLSNTFSDRQHN